MLVENPQYFDAFIQRRQRSMQGNGRHRPTNAALGPVWGQVIDLAPNVATQDEFLHFGNAGDA